MMIPCIPLLPVYLSIVFSVFKRGSYDDRNIEADAHTDGLMMIDIGIHDNNP